MPTPLPSPPDASWAGDGGAEAAAMVRIGELSRRVGVSDHTLRAWEHRYGLMKPHRTEGGFRLYTPADQARVLRMKELIGSGLSSSEAARIAGRMTDPEAVAWRDAHPVAERVTPRPVAPPPGSVLPEPVATFGPGPGIPSPTLAAAIDALADATDVYDDHRAHALIDRLLADFSVGTVFGHVLLPFLRREGDRWHRGDITVAQEHYASQLIRGRLGGLARGWAEGRGPLVVVACPSGELHDIASMMFGIVLHHGGWRVLFLGADTPVQSIFPSVSPPPDLVMLAATTPARFRSCRADIERLAALVPVALAGPGASGRLARSVGALHVNDDPIRAAEDLIANGVPHRPTSSR